MKVRKCRLMGQAKINSINSSRRWKENFYDRPGKKEELLYWIYWEAFYGSSRFRLHFSNSVCSCSEIFHITKTKRIKGINFLTSEIESHKTPLTRSWKLLNQNWLLIFLNPATQIASVAQTINLKALNDTWAINQSVLRLWVTECS